MANVGDCIEFYESKKALRNEYNEGQYVLVDDDRCAEGMMLGVVKTSGSRQKVTKIPTSRARVQKYSPTSSYPRTESRSPSGFIDLPATPKSQCKGVQSRKICKSTDGCQWIISGDIEYCKKRATASPRAILPKKTKEFCKTLSKSECPMDKDEHYGEMCRWSKADELCISRTGKAAAAAEEYYREEDKEYRNYLLGKSRRKVRKSLLTGVSRTSKASVSPASSVSPAVKKLRMPVKKSPPKMSREDEFDLLFKKVAEVLEIEINEDSSEALKQDLNNIFPKQYRNQNTLASQLADTMGGDVEDFMDAAAEVLTAMMAEMQQEQEQPQRPMRPKRPPRPSQKQQQKQQKQQQKQQKQQQQQEQLQKQQQEQQKQQQQQEQQSEDTIDQLIEAFSIVGVEGDEAVDLIKDEYKEAKGDVTADLIESLLNKLADGTPKQLIKARKLVLKEYMESV